MVAGGEFGLADGGGEDGVDVGDCEGRGGGDCAEGA